MISSLIRFLKITVGGALAALVLRALWSTIRWRGIIGSTEQPESAAVIAFWHGRLLMMPFVYRRAWSGRSRAPRVLISQHGDGRLIACAVRLLGFRSVAGSSTKGGRKALRELIRIAQEGFDIGFTPDGPRGPKHECKEGIAMLARIAQVPVYPMCYAVDRRWQLRSWDGMIVPKPFAEGVMVVGSPVVIDRSEDHESARLRIQEALDEVTRRADAYWPAA
jgi:lysophospholipid acyltransferase (LPLAT)-like uncharacterized protein